MFSRTIKWHGCSVMQASRQDGKNLKSFSQEKEIAKSIDATKKKRNAKALKFMGNDLFVKRSERTFSWFEPKLISWDAPTPISTSIGSKALIHLQSSYITAYELRELSDGLADKSQTAEKQTLGSNTTAIECIFDERNILFAILVCNQAWILSACDSPANECNSDKISQSRFRFAITYAISTKDSHFFKNIL